MCDAHSVNWIDYGASNAINRPMFHFLPFQPHQKMDFIKSKTSAPNEDDAKFLRTFSSFSIKKLSIFDEKTDKEACRWRLTACPSLNTLLNITTENKQPNRLNYEIWAKCKATKDSFVWFSSAHTHTHNKHSSECQKLFHDHFELLTPECLWYILTLSLEVIRLLQ